MRRHTVLLAGLISALLAALAGLSLGAANLSPDQWMAALGVKAAAPADAWVRAVLLDVRLPRVLFGLVLGAVLAQCGVVLQALLRNPLAETSLLGISGGAALAAAAWLVLLPQFGSLSWLNTVIGLPAAASVGAILAVAMVLRLSRSGGLTHITTLLLAGISINALAGAGIALLQTLASDAALRDLTLWLYGSLGRASWLQLGFAVPLLLAIALWLPREARALDALLLGEADAAQLGVEVEALKRRLLLLVTVATATGVALAGIIGFIGLIVPHLLRLWLGPGHRLLLPAAALYGAALLTLADTAARTLFAPLEVPVGVLTALAGVPLFLVLLRSRGLR